MKRILRQSLFSGLIAVFLLFCSSVYSGTQVLSYQRRTRSWTGPDFGGSTIRIESHHLVAIRHRLDFGIERCPSRDCIMDASGGRADGRSVPELSHEQH